MDVKIYFNYTDFELQKLSKGQYNYIYYGKELFNNLEDDNDAEFTYLKYDFSLNKSSKIMTYLISFNLNLLFCNKYNYYKYFKNKYYCPLTITKNNLFYYKIFSSKIRNSNFYIKPSDGSCGISIKITKDPMSYIKKNKDFIAQKEIPINIFRERKWDVRIYIIHQIVNGNFFTYLYKDGVLRLAPEKYSRKNNNFRSLVTNTSLLRYDDNFEDLNFPFYTHPEYNFYFIKILKVVTNIHKYIKAKFVIKRNRYLSEFQLLGYDFIFSKNKSPYLLEVNYCPNAISENNSKSVTEMKLKMYKNIYLKFIKTPIINFKKYNLFKSDNLINDNFIDIN
jgi:hypothetical protein